MREATLRKPIVAENEDTGENKHFPVGAIIYVDDSDDNWFVFEDAAGDYFYAEEQPDNVLEYEEGHGEKVSSVAVNTYTPVPNMTPLSRKHLLL